MASFSASQAGSTLTSCFAATAQQGFGRGLRGDFLADGLGQARVQAQPAPFAVEVDGALGGLQHAAGADGVRGGEDDLLDAVGHHELVGVGLVALQRGELRGVRGVHALVAEDAPDLEDAVDASDHGALEEQLGGDAQGHRLVERVQVGVERPGRGAAVDELEHRGLHLHVVARMQGVADGTGDGGTLVDHLAGLVAHDQVRVALADAGFLVQFRVQHRERAQGLGGHPPLLGHDGQLATAGGDHLALDEDVVAEVHQALPLGEGLLADVGQGDHGLQAGAVAVGPPSWRVAKQSLPVLRRNTTRPTTPTVSVVSSPASRWAHCSRTSPREWVRGRRPGTGRGRQRSVQRACPGAPGAGRWSRGAWRRRGRRCFRQSR